jgi:serine/threonine-protein kinase
MSKSMFLDSLEKSQLLSPRQLADVSAEIAGGANVEEIVKALIADDVLTTYQATKIRAGGAESLVLGQYRIRKELGRGGMSCVYEAVHSVMGRTVAIKIMNAATMEGPEKQLSFRREVATATQLHHPNIVMAYDANEVNGTHFLVMEYVDGVSLHALVKRNGSLPVGLVCEMGRQVAMALQYSHEKGVVHRDIKPGNLMVPRIDVAMLSPPCPEAAGPAGPLAQPLVKVMDFGLARLRNGRASETIRMKAGSDFIGTPDYVSPEQAHDVHSVDIRSDLYSLGCTLYFALAGKPPFGGDGKLLEVLLQHVMDTPTPVEEIRPDVPPEVAACIHRLLAKEPADRFPTPAALATALAPYCAIDLQEIARLTPVPPPVPSSEGRTPPWPISQEHIPTNVCPLSEGNGSDARDLLDVPIPLDLEAGQPFEESPDQPVPLDLDIGLAFENSAEQPSQPPSLAELARHWHAWIDVLIACFESHGRYPRLSPHDYESLHTALLGQCQVLAASRERELRDKIKQVDALVRPWLSLGTLTQADPLVLGSLLRQCRQLEHALNLPRAKRPWGPTVAALAVAVLIAVVGVFLVKTAPPLSQWAPHTLSRWLPHVKFESLIGLGVLTVAVIAYLMRRP